MQPYKDWRHLMTDPEFADIVVEDLRVLHLTRTQAMFDTLAAVVKLKWENEGETRLAEVVNKEYFEKPYNRWFVTASGVPGVLPSSQPQESYHKQVKANKIFSLRARMDHMIHDQVPALLLFDSMDLTGNMGSFVPDLLPSEVVEKAAGYKPVDIQEYPANSRMYYVNTGDFKGTKVSVVRCFNYQVSAVPRVAPTSTTLASFQKTYMGLHLVQPITAPGVGQQPYKCDCKGYWHSLVCAHVLAVRNLLGEMSLSEAMDNLPVRQARGRKRKSKGAWYRQTASPPRERSAPGASSGARGGASGARGAASGARGGASGARGGASGARGGASGARGAASGARGGANSITAEMVSAL
jgi:hypothetical protein